MTKKQFISYVRFVDSKRDDNTLLPEEALIERPLPGNSDSTFTSITVYRWERVGPGNDKHLTNAGTLSWADSAPRYVPKFGRRTKHGYPDAIDAFEKRANHSYSDDLGLEILLEDD